MARRALYFKTYQQALKNVEGGKPSIQDEMIVSQWTVIANLQKTVAESNLKLSLTETHQENEVNEASALLDRFRSGIMMPAAVKPTTQGEA